jgi:hypothetical protein
MNALSVFVWFLLDEVIVTGHVATPRGLRTIDVRRMGRMVALRHFADVVARAMLSLRMVMMHLLVLDIHVIWLDLRRRRHHLMLLVSIVLRVIPLVRNTEVLAIFMIHAMVQGWRMRLDTLYCVF